MWIGAGKWHNCRLHFGCKEVAQRSKRIIAADAIKGARVPLESFDEDASFKSVITMSDTEIIRWLIGVHEECPRIVHHGSDRRHACDTDVSEGLTRDERQRCRHICLVNQVHVQRRTIESKPKLIHLSR